MMNSFSGPLPHTWSTLVKLESLGLANDQLTGQLPASWSTLTVSRTFGHVSHCQTVDFVLRCWEGSGIH